MRRGIYHGDAGDRALTASASAAADRLCAMCATRSRRFPITGPQDLR